MKYIQLPCAVCGQIFMREAKEYRKNLRRGRKNVCSVSCKSKLNVIRNQKGENNGNWKGGVSKNNMRYKKRQILRYPERVKARAILGRAVHRGKIKPQPCEECGDLFTVAHHEDYTKPLDVIWLCRRHHRERHNGIH